MSLDPTSYIREVGLDRTGVEKIAGSMAARQGTRGSVIMGLDLEHPYAVIELIDNSELLIGCCVVGHHEGAVMGSDKGNIAVLPTAKFRIIVACLCIDWSS